MRGSSRRQSPANSSMTRNMRGDRASARVARMVGSSVRISCSAALVATNFIVGRCTASAIASASLKSFFCPLLWGGHIWPASTCIVTKRCEFAAQVMCADAGFDADQARRYIGEPRVHLATRPLLPQHDGAARIVAHDVERVLANIDADHGDRGIEYLRHGVLLVFGAPCQLRLLAVPDGGPTIPLPGVDAPLTLPPPP